VKAVIPYKKSSARSRLSPVMTREERGEFVELMLNQVIDTLKEAGIEKMAL
jgi:2-phospho-L-lactate guanylyltransferase